MIDFTLYPNLNGQLGQNKVQIPDGVTTFWPDGDALVNNFIYKDGKLSGFVDTKALIANESKTTTIPYDFVQSEFENVREESVTFNLSDRCKYFTLKLMPKYKGCKTVNDIKTIDENYIENDIVDGVWTKELEDLEKGNISTSGEGIYDGMFYNCESLIIFNKKMPFLKDAHFMFHNCSNLTSFESDLNSLTNGRGMFRECSNLITFKGNISSITSGGYMFYNCSKTNFGSFETKLSFLTRAENMFYNCSNLTSFKSDLSSLDYAIDMFRNCSNLTTFKSDLSSLTNGGYMFYNCSNLTSFNSDLSSLTNGSHMFYICTNLTSFESDLSSLTNGYWMFRNCEQITSFTSDLSSLTNGYGMFNYCSNLTTFKSDLSSLTNGGYMFNTCKLDTQSLKNIAETINTVTESQLIHIGIGNTTPTEEENTYLTQIHNKGWQVFVNGSSTNFEPTDGTSLIPIDGEQNLNPIPFWAKPVPSTQEEANYIDENGNYYNILGGQFIYVNDPESYGMFMNEEDAAAQMRLTRIEKEDI